MSDITNLFKATIKTVKTREKLLNASLVDKSILPKSSKKSEFTQSAKNVVLLISKLKEFLLDNRKDYLNATGFFGLEQSAMNDLERDRIDTEAETFMKMCKEAIHQLKLQSESHKVLRQVRKHKEGVLGVIERYLIAVCQMYSEQKAIRVKRMVDKKRMARLQTEPINKFVTPIRENPAEDEEENNSRQINKINHSGEQNKLTSTARVSESSEVQGHKEGNLTADETMMLQMENDQIFNELSTMVDEIKQVEGKIVEISRLQNIFAEKILEQEQDIGKVAETVVMTTENIKEANEVIREAMKNNAGFRVWILFFLVVCTLSLLFLDWYNA